MNKHDPMQKKVQDQFEEFEKANPKHELAGLLEQRGKQYGKFEGHANITQGLKRVIYSHPNIKNMRDEHLEALDMIVHKIGRIVNGNPDHEDSWVDIAGYATLVAKIIKGNGV